MNTAADFLSRAEVNPTEQLEVKIRNDVITKAIEVNIQFHIFIIPQQEQLTI